VGHLPHDPTSSECLVAGTTGDHAQNRDHQTDADPLDPTLQR